MIYPYDVKVNCYGRANVKYFGQQKSVKVFDFTKSVSFAWSHDDDFNGNWGANIWIGLPKPLAWIGLSLKIELSYFIDLNLSGSVYDPNPYTYQIKAIVDANVLSDSHSNCCSRI